MPALRIFEAGLCLAIIALVTHGGHAHAWTVRVAGSVASAEPQAFAVAVDASDDIIAVGTIENLVSGPDFFVIKLEGKDGSEIWRSQLDGPSDRDFRSEQALAVAVSPTGDVVVGGYYEKRDPPGGNSDPHMVVVKYAGADGQQLWLRELDVGHATSVLIDAAGDVYAGRAGTVYKLDGTTGADIWVGSPAGGIILLDGSGSLFAIGSSITPTTGLDVRVEKLDPGSGGTLWSMTSGVPGDESVKAATIGTGGDIYVAGSLADAGGVHASTLRLASSDGSVVWQATLDDPTWFDGYAKAVAMDDQGDVVTGGGIQLTGGSTDPQALVAKLGGADGQEIWRHLMPADLGLQESLAGVAETVAAAPGGDVFAGGFVQSVDLGDSLVARLAGADGEELWRDDGSVNGGGVIGAMVTDSAGHVVAVGQTEEEASAREFFVLKLAGFGGTDFPCGDSIVDADESCDDGNGDSCDGCTPSCRVELGESCGDGLLNAVCGERCDDGGTADGDGCSSTCEDQSAPESAAGTVPAGGSLTTDIEGDGATPSDPVETTVSSPAGGDVAIDESSTEVASTGFQLLALQVDITAPNGTVDDPIVLVLRIDATRVPAGGNPESVEILRDGTPVGECGGLPGQAVPDPCVATRVLRPDGDVETTVHTTQASLWNSGVVAEMAVPVEGSKLLIRDSERETRRKIVFVARDESIVPVDPRCGAGTGGCAKLEVVGIGGSGQRVEIDLPCDKWSLLGKAQSPKGYKYRDKNLEAGPCKTVVVKQGRIKAVCIGKNAASPLGYDLTSDGEAGVAVRFGDGPFVTYCAAFLGVTGAKTSVDTATLFKAAKAPAPGSCFGGPVVSCAAP